MINSHKAKQYCREDISLIENHNEAIADQKRTWDIHHRRETDSEGKTLFTKKQLIEMNLYYNRPASELIFVTRSMHWKLHREMRGKILNEKLTFEQRSKAGKKHSIPIIQLNKDGKLIKEWLSIKEAGRQLGISQSSISACLRYGRKLAGGFVWRYKDPLL